MQNRIQQLNEEIAAHDQRYYSDDAPTIPDAQYDNLLVELRDLVEKNGAEGTVLATAGKGTLSPHLSKVRHIRPMISLRTEVDTGITPIEKFHDRVRKYTDKVQYIAEPKYDGLGVSLRYQNGKLQVACTRGDTETGEDVTASILGILNVPSDISGFPKGSEIEEIRGEVLLRNCLLPAINNERTKEGKKEYVNARNAAAGIVRTNSAISPVIGSGLLFIPYSIHGDRVPFDTQKECLEWLSESFRWDYRFSLADTPEQLMEKYKDLESTRPSMEIDIDGIVYKVNDLSLQAKMGTSGREPRWAIAHKFVPQVAQTTLDMIDIQVGPTGRLTPVARLVPVFVGGATVTNVTLSNVFQVRKKGVRAGDMIVVQRAGDVIPEILGKAPGFVRSGYVPNFRIPSKCPICGSSVVRERGESNHYCVGSTTCPAQIAGTLAFIVSRGCLNVQGFGDSLAQSLVDKKIVHHPLEFISLTEEQLVEAGLGPLESQKVLKEIQRVRTESMRLDKFFLSLAVSSIGERASRKMAAHFMSADKFITGIYGDNFYEIPGLNSLNIRNLRGYLHSYTNRQAMMKFMSHITVRENEVSQGPLSGKSVVVTGSAPGVSRDVVKDHIGKLGGSVSGSVSKNTSLVVYGDGAGDKLKKAEQLDVERLTYQEFFKQYNLNI